MRAWAKQSCAQLTAREETHLASHAAGFSSIFRRGEVIVEELCQQPPLAETSDELCEAARTLGVPEAEPDNAIYLGERATVSRVKALSKSSGLARALSILPRWHNAVPMA